MNRPLPMPRVREHPQAGFTMLELVVAMFITALVLLATWTMFGAAGDQQLSGWREAERRSEVAAAERVLAGAISAAGHAMPSSPNLGGIHVARAGAGADTLYTLEGTGRRMRVAARGCAWSPGTCVLVLGDHRHDLHAGATVLVGSAGAGLQAMRVADPPAAFSGACGADCLERLLCAIVPEDPSDAPAVAGSVLRPPAAAPVPSAEPCPQPVLADGTTCTENESAVSVTPLAPERCTASGPAAAYTEVHLAAAGTSWGLPLPQVAPALRGGSGGTPAPLLQEVRVARFWVRSADSTLVKQADPGPAGWASTQPLAAHVTSLTAELLHAGGTAWTRGLAMPEWFLDHGSYNSNYVRPPAPGDSAPAAWRFRYGYHTVAAVRVTLGFLRPDGAEGWAADVRRFVTATPAVRDGARGEGGS
jgi:prepilin-type N-terminal cleavage/methylation domain-containing protein